MTYSPSHGLYVSQGNDTLYMPNALKKKKKKSHSKTYLNDLRLTLGYTLLCCCTDKLDAYVNREICVYSY